MMFRIERFMASAMSLVRMPPEAPTRAPAMIRTGLPMTKPAIAAAVPVNELSSEMTTGMSAPPMGSTIVTPKSSPARTTAPRMATLRRGVEGHDAGRAEHEGEETGDRDEREAAMVTSATAREDDRLARDRGPAACPRRSASRRT